MENDALKSTDACELNRLLEAHHGATAMQLCDQFALGCWLYYTGHKRAGDKIVKDVISTVRSPRTNRYLDAVEKAASDRPARLALSVWPHPEICELFEHTEL
jgi:hypothetical protein